MTEELNRRHNLATMPTINNNGESYIVPFDIYKEGYEAYDISNWFKGRVGDSGTPFGIRWYKHGQLMDVTGMRPFIEGQVGDYTIDDSDPDDPKINMDSEASNVHVVGEVNDCQEYGVAIYRLINQAMPQSGIFYGKIGVMGAQDDGTTVMSSVDVVFKVLAGHMNMMGARKFYVSELEKAWLEMQAKFKQYNQEYKDTTTKQAEQFKADTEKALADLNTKIANEIKRAEDTLGDTQASIDANIASLKRIATTCASIQAEIDANDIVKLSDFNDQTKALANGQKNLDSAITSKLAAMSTQPELFDNEDAIKAKYPKGTVGIKIATNTWHGWGFINGEWKDLGDYKPTTSDPTKTVSNVEAHLDDSLKISWTNGSEGNVAFKIPANVDINGAVHSYIKLDDIKAAAENSPIVSYENGEFIGKSFICVYRPNTYKVEFINLNDALSEDIFLFGNNYQSWIGGYLVEDALAKLNMDSQRVHYGYLYGQDFKVTIDGDLTLGFSITLYGSNKYVELDGKKIIQDIKEQLKSNPLDGVTLNNGVISGKNYLITYNWITGNCRIYNDAFTRLQYAETNIFSNYYGNFEGLAFRFFEEKDLSRKVLSRNFQEQYKGTLYGANYTVAYTYQTLLLNFNITIWGSSKYVDLTSDEIIKDIKPICQNDPNLTLNGETLKGKEFTLYFDFYEGKTKVSSSGLMKLNDDQVDIFSNYYGHYDGLAYHRSLIEHYEPTLIFTDKSTNISYPAYFYDNLTQAIHKVRKNIARVGKDGLTFLWITDVHWENNDKNSPALVKEMMHEAQIPYMVGGGDFFNENPDKDAAFQCLNDAISAYRIPGIDFPNVVGNHDDNSNFAPVKEEITFNDQELASAFFNPNPTNDKFKLLNYPNDLSWQIEWLKDDPLSSSYNLTGYGFDTKRCWDPNQSQMNNLINLAKEKRNIIIFAHCMLDCGKWHSWSNDLNKIVDAINTHAGSVTTKTYGTMDLTGVQGHIIAEIAGHEHQDNLRYTDNGTPCIITDSDNGPRTYNNTQYPYVKGTITEQCFSVFTFDLKNKKIYEVRVGRGKDRTFNFK